MKRQKIKKITCSVLAVFAASVLLASCGGTNDNPTDPDATDIVIYAGGSSEFTWSKGTKEDEVIDYIEQCYYEDTGVKLNFKINFDTGKNMKTTIAKDISAGTVDIVISHTSGGDGIDDYMINNELYMNLVRTLTSYDMLDSGFFTLTVGSENQTTFDGIQRLTTENEEIIGIPSMINPYKFGILVRKDWMEACGYTDDPDKVADGYELVDNFETFADMAVAMKEKYNRNGSTDYVLTGAIFDIEKAGLLGACGLDAGYYTNTSYTDEDGNAYVGPGYINPGYSEVLEIEYEWKEKGIIAQDCDNILLNEGENDFISGKTGIFVQDPTVTHLISVARRTKAADSSAEFTVLGALAKDRASVAEAEENGTEPAKGFMRNSVATFAACVTKNSAHVKEIIAFLKWCYSDKDNYLLCRYGREGIDWFYDEENQTYSYASDDEFVNPPYSGILTLVENQAIANLTYAGYTEEELGWIATAEDESNYLNNETIDYCLLTTRTDLQNQRDTAASTMGTTIRSIWNRGVSSDEIVSSFEAARKVYLSSANTYLTTMATTYATLRATFNS